MDRGKVDAPAVLTRRGAKGPQELADARRHYRRYRNKRYDVKNFEAYKDGDVKAALHELFGDKCAYCESSYIATAPVDVEHYRPKGSVKEDSKLHPGYWWLAMAWTNLLPSCIDCNRSRKQIAVQQGMTMEDLRRAAKERARQASGKEDSFPTADSKWVRSEGSVARERPLLLNPTVDEPGKHLRWVVDEALAIVLPVRRNGVEDPRGVASIAVYGLNRLGLVQCRTQLLQEMRERSEHALEQIDRARRTTDRRLAVELIQDAKNIAQKLGERCQPRKPYSALARAFIAWFEKELEKQL